MITSSSCGSQQQTVEPRGGPANSLDWNFRSSNMIYAAAAKSRLILSSLMGVGVRRNGRGWWLRLSFLELSISGLIATHPQCDGYGINFCRAISGKARLLYPTKLPRRPFAIAAAQVGKSSELFRRLKTTIRSRETQAVQDKKFSAK